MIDSEESSQLERIMREEINNLVRISKWVKEKGREKTNTHATLRRARSIRFLGRRSLDRASWLGVAGLSARDISILEKLLLPVVLRLLLAVMSKMDGVALWPLLPGVENGEFFLHVPD
jgi:hypothetical protein